MMVKDVSLMVLPGSPSDEALPQLLIYQDGIWYDTSPLSGSSISLKDLRKNTDRQLNELMGQVDNVQSFRRGLMSICWGLYQSIVNEDVRKVLDEAAQTGNGNEVPTLHVYFPPKLEWIPWEIMWVRAWDKPGFLGLRFQIARLPIVATPPNVSSSQPHAVRRIHNILGEDVLTPPPNPLFDTWKNTFHDLLAATVEECQLPDSNGVGMVGSWPTLDEVGDAAEQDDILHFTCHGGLKDQNEEIYWTLNQQKYIPFKHRVDHSFVQLLKLTTSRPLVFGNACASNAAGNQGGLSPGLGTSFFTQGALNFVGTFAPITKDLAVEFARQFYWRLLHDQMPIGKALWATKKYFFDLQGNDPSYLFYCLYGPSETRFQILP